MMGPTLYGDNMGLNAASNAMESQHRTLETSRRPFVSVPAQKDTARKQAQYDEIWHRRRTREISLHASILHGTTGCADSVAHFSIYFVQCRRL